MEKMGVSVGLGRVSLPRAAQARCGHDESPREPRLENQGLEAPGLVKEIEDPKRWFLRVRFWNWEPGNPSYSLQEGRPRLLAEFFFHDILTASMWIQSNQKAETIKRL